MLTLSLRERDRLVVLRQVQEGTLKPVEGARRLGITPRHFRRLCRRFEADGDGVVIHGLRGRPSNRRRDDRIRTRALERAREPLFHDFGPTLLAEHLSQDPEIGLLNPDTLRAWMIAEELWTPKKRGQRHRHARPRRAAVGELIQLDGSDHAWLEARHPARLVLLKAIDDATNRIQVARFVPRETGAAHRQLLIDYLERHGRPQAFYTDKAGCFGQKTRPHSADIPLEEREAKLTESLIRTAFETLNIELILANSPQAKGRVERDFGTSQDRLVKELRLAGICTLEDANRFLEEVYVPQWNDRFVVEAADPTDAHRSLPDPCDLHRLFAVTETRSVANDFTIRYRNQRLQISEAEATGIRPRDKITIEHRLDGSTRFRHGDRYLAPELVAACKPRGPRHEGTAPALKKPKAAKPKASNGTRKPRPDPPKPGPDHPWRRFPIRVGKANRPTPAAARPAPSSPEASG